MSAVEWLAEMARRPRGRVWRSNLAYDVERRRLPAAAWDAFLRALEEHLGAAPVAGEPLGLIDEVVQRQPKAFLLRGPEFTGPRDAYSRVVDAWSYARYHVDPDLGLELDENADTKLLALMDAGIYAARHQVGEMKTRQDFFWCTTSAALEELARRGAGDELANAIRDCLGLGTWRVGVSMLRIDVPLAAMQGKRMHAPTTLDAGSNVFFLPDADPAGHGWTMHLGRMDRGAPELLVEKLTLDERYVVRRVGAVTRPQPAIDWERLAEMCRTRLSVSGPEGAPTATSGEAA